MARITLDGVAHTYGDPRDVAAYALKRLDHSWEQGRAYALLGPSGCGKTTLLNVISGLVTPSQGRILFDGKDVTHLPTEQRNIAQVFQFPVVYDTMSVTQNLAFPLKNRGMARPAIDKRVAEIADLLGLNAYLQRRARGLSADVKQKISLGRGLVRPDVAAVLFDEPLTVIDPSLKWELRSKLKAVHRALDLLMIYVTHDQVEALTFADEVVVMKDGRVLQIATPAQLFEQPEHTFVGYFLGSPGMNLVPADVNGSTARIDGQTVSLGARYSAPPAGSAVRLGFRPDYASVVPSGGLTVRVQKIEDLGRRRLARLSLGSHQIYATVPPEVSLSGDTAGLIIRPERLFVYVNDERVSGAPA
jgi:glycerol transport system ATP-binding protein